MKNKYPIYIVSKGRWENPMTARLFMEDGVDFKILVEPQEYNLYCSTIPAKYVEKLPFANLGLGSYPARNYAWEQALKNGYDRHWVFDDNIRKTRILKKGKRLPVNTLKAICAIEDFTDRYKNIGISGFNYLTFVLPDVKKPFYLNVHVYSCMLINTYLPFRWRLKYNEDVDLCLQALHNKYCTVLFNVFMMDKTSTVAKMKGGNQDELYLGNAFEKKVLKARSLEEIWPQYVKTVLRFNRPHHFVDWKRYFKHSLIRRDDIDFAKLDKVNDYGLKLRVIKKDNNIVSQLKKNKTI